MTATKKRYSEKAKVWHIMITANGGTVSLLQNLDAPTARQAYTNAMMSMPFGFMKPPAVFIDDESIPETDDSWSSYIHHSRDSDTKDVKILGPAGADLGPWRDGPFRTVNIHKRRRKREARAKEKAAKAGLVEERGIAGHYDTARTQGW